MKTETLIFGWCLPNIEEHEKCPENDEVNYKDEKDSKASFKVHFLCECECHRQQEKAMIA